MTDINNTWACKQCKRQVTDVDPPSDSTCEYCILYNADPNCQHDIQSLWSGVKCRKCPGWFCF